MDMSSRFIVSVSILNVLKERAEDNGQLPAAQETFYLPKNHKDLSAQLRFGFIRLRKMDGDTVELSCNRRVYKHIGYEHEKYILFIGNMDQAMYLIEALGLERIGQINHIVHAYYANTAKDFRFLYTLSSSQDRSLETLKIEAETEDGLIRGYQYLGIDPTEIIEVDPVVMLLT